ncbi:MAG: hypothetical protein CME63_01500 [Halobacteriovoraceae bacterium]|nr:hypothetical protein [Halobacteriovoraceae bacterium]
MSFKKGEQRPAKAGRKKGTPNKRTNKVIELLKGEGYDPLLEAVKLLQEPYKSSTELCVDYEDYVEFCRDNDQDPMKLSNFLEQKQSQQLTAKEKLDGHIKLIKYVYPARKAIEVSMDEGKVAPVLNISLTPPKENE